ncbi:ABC transporter ATP-binding protein [Peribacillus sp. SCS-155]|uniref:ABC transporter ATP-binding protein n=1 Tax=Peribacillus sedimenti TaxID=3115297 RepID=UPI003905974A
MEMVLQAEGIAKMYGTKGNVYRALNGVDIQVERGEFMGIMGPSGAGKSTLLNVLSTIDSPSQGTVKINQENIHALKDSELAKFRRAQLGFIFQDFHLLDTLTVKENILLPLSLANLPVREMEQRIEQIAKIFNLGEILEKYPYEISGGQQQRTATARAVISNPNLIFADEPTGALDSKSALTLLQTLSQLNKEEKSTILMVTHDAYAASFCTRVLFIKDGVIFTELRKGQHTRKQFFEQIIHILTALGGGRQYDSI